MSIRHSFGKTYAQNYGHQQQFKKAAGGYNLTRFGYSRVNVKKKSYLITAPAAGN